MTDWIELISEAISTEKAAAFVADPSCGGIAIFLGTTRADQNGAGQSLIALEYEAYPEMALQQLRQITVVARQKWPIVKVAILHRIGTVVIAEPSVLVGVSTPHRQEAFEACRWIMDSVKKTAAIWKKEVWADGSGTWVHPPPLPRE